MEIPDILVALAAELCRHDSIEPASVKAYHTLHTNWITDEWAPEGFAHITLSLITGRDPALLKAIGESMFKVMKELFSESLESDDARLTFEIREMPREIYWKSG
jgi:5-carboxymethyl-2-hydroxymuconate isomerase